MNFNVHENRNMSINAVIEQRKNIRIPLDFKKAETQG